MHLELGRAAPGLIKEEQASLIWFAETASARADPAPVVAAADSAAINPL